MAANPKFPFVWVAILLISFAIFIPADANAALGLYLNSIETPPNNDSIVFTVTVDNFSPDSIVGYSLWITINGDLVGFYADSVWEVDTVFENCQDSSCIQWIYEGQDSSCLGWDYDLCDTVVDSAWVSRGAIDVVGTETEDWDWVKATVIDSYNRILKVNAIANTANPYTPGLPPATSQASLIKIIAYTKDPQTLNDSNRCYPLPWDSCFCDSLFNIQFDPYASYYSNEDQQLVYFEWEDTAYECLQIPPGVDTCVRKCVEDECLDSVCAYENQGTCYLWECTDCQVWDSIGSVNQDSIFYVNGDIEVVCESCQGLCGDANNDSSVDVSDAVFIISFAFGGGTPPQPVTGCGDANSDASVDVSDAVFIINYAFVGGNPPGDCSPGSWAEPDCCPFGK